MQGLTDKLNQGLDFAKGKGNEALSYLSQNPKITSMLLAGGGAGLLGGGLTAMGQNREGESKGSRTMRIIRNAILAGGAGAGAVGLGQSAMGHLENAIPANTQHPIQEALTSNRTRGAMGAGGAALGYSMGSKVDSRRHLRDVEAQYPEAYKKIPQSELKGFPKDTSHASAVEYATKHHGFQPKSSPTLLGKYINRIGNKTVREGLHSTVGRTSAGQGARALGAAGVFLPEILGGVKSMAPALLGGVDGSDD